MPDPISMMALMMLGGAGIQAAGNIGGGLLSGMMGGGNQGPTQNQLKDLPTTAWVPSANPVYNALQTNLLLGLGQPLDIGLLNAASPISQLSNQLATGVGQVSQKNAAALNDFQRQLQGLLSGVPDPKQQKPFPFDPTTASTQEIVDYALQTLPSGAVGQVQRALALAGYQNLGQLIDAERQFRTDTQALQQRYQGMGEDIASARSAGARLLSEQLSGYPTFTTGDLERLAAIEQGRMNQEVLAQANVAGVNPSAGYASVASSLAPYERALAILGAGQQSAQNALNAGAQGFYGPIELAISGASPILAAANANQSTAAQQALAMMSMMKPSTAGSDIGTGIAAGAGTLGNAFSTLSLLDYMAQRNNSPGAGAIGGNQPMSSGGFTGLFGKS